MIQVGNISSFLQEVSKCFQENCNSWNLFIVGLLVCMYVCMYVCVYVCMYTVCVCTCTVYGHVNTLNAVGDV